jgi:multidrug efflux pump subunit AcrA (membrane-fusion protein)
MRRTGGRRWRWLLPFPLAVVAAASVREAEAQLAAARVRLAHARVLAPSAETILVLDVEVGDVVDGDRALLTLGGDGPTWLSTRPDERALGTVRVGQVARASSEALPDRSFEARVDWVSPAVDESRGTVEVRLVVSHA